MTHEEKEAIIDMLMSPDTSNVKLAIEILCGLEDISADDSLYIINSVGVRAISSMNSYTPAGVWKVYSVYNDRYGVGHLTVIINDVNVNYKVVNNEVHIFNMLLPVENDRFKEMVCESLEDWFKHLKPFI